MMAFLIINFAKKFNCPMNSCMSYLKLNKGHIDFYRNEESLRMCKIVKAKEHFFLVFVFKFQK